MTFLLFLFGAILLLVLVSGAYVFIAGCVRFKELPWLDPVTLSKTPYGRFSEHIAAAKAWLDAHDAQDISIVSGDGLELHGLWVPAENAKGTVMLVHGYRSCILVDFGLVFDYYHNQGMNLLLPEQRSHGRSQGRFITFGIKESEDMLKWLTYHNDTFGKFPILLSGLSMGASTVMYLTDESLPENVRGIIADCGFTSPKAIISSVFTKATHMPVIPSVWVVDLFARLFAGFSLSEKDTRVTLTRNQLPILMVHGTADTFVPASMTEEAYAVCTGKKQLFLVEGATHGVSYLHAKEKYTELVEQFIKNVMEGE